MYKNRPLGIGNCMNSSSFILLTALSLGWLLLRNSMTIQRDPDIGLTTGLGEKTVGDGRLLCRQPRGSWFPAGYETAYKIDKLRC